MAPREKTGESTQTHATRDDAPLSQPSTGHKSKTETTRNDNKTSPQQTAEEGIPGTKKTGDENSLPQRIGKGDSGKPALTKIFESEEYKRTAKTLNPEELTKLRENLISKTAGRMVQKNKQRNPGRWVKKNLFPISAVGSTAIALYVAIHNKNKDFQDLKIKQQELELKVRDLKKKLTSNAQNDEDEMKIKKSLIEDEKNNDPNYTGFMTKMDELYKKYDFNTELTDSEGREILRNGIQTLGINKNGGSNMKDNGDSEKKESNKPADKQGQGLQKQTEEIDSKMKEEAEKFSGGKFKTAYVSEDGKRIDVRTELSDGGIVNVPFEDNQLKTDQAVKTASGSNQWESFKDIGNTEKPIKEEGSKSGINKNGSSNMKDNSGSKEEGSESGINKNESSNTENNGDSEKNKTNYGSNSGNAITRWVNNLSEEGEWEKLKEGMNRDPGGNLVGATVDVPISAFNNGYRSIADFGQDTEYKKQKMKRFDSGPLSFLTELLGPYPDVIDYGVRKLKNLFGNKS
ncbi:hypothetical protein [Pasteuria penetrans]|uniref:hypothetical protein n=1 Tax=Pasteuria penetrans TaxID=86005 RepID=UPI0011ECBC3B|nr:hypothetical protein [Pasteuria penetrans]